VSPCLVCLEDAPAGARYHTKCVRELFGTRAVPTIDVELAKLHTAALAMVGHTSLSGVQRKVSLGLSVERATLRVAAEGGRYILKPQAQTFPALPENEHVTMRIAARAGIEVPPNGLVTLKDGSLAYLVKRFDRIDGTKLLQEDFCQLAGRAPKDKYSGSAELCARLVYRYASEPLIEARKLFRLVVVSWWTGNGDMHLKNFSLLRGSDGRHRLSPGYDLLCTRLVIPGDQLALAVAGNKKNVTRRQWLELAAACKLPARAAERVLAEIVAAASDAGDLVTRSALPEEMKTDYRRLIAERTTKLVAAAR
jgi:serine/threonine-protein kinase HipA